jgi:hypothetical protein
MLIILTAFSETICYPNAMVSHIKKCKNITISWDRPFQENPLEKTDTCCANSRVKMYAACNNNVPFNHATCNDGGKSLQPMTWQDYFFYQD